MDPRFTRGEYWLLETAVEFKFPVCGLIDSDFELSLNKKGHGLTRDALVETLHRLIAWGLISAENEGDAPISTHQQIERALNESHTYYGLTPEGGAHWEAFAAPDWQKYIEDNGLQLPDECEKWLDAYIADFERENGTQERGYGDRKWSEALENFVADFERENGRHELMCADKAWLEKYIESLCFDRQTEVSLATVEWDYIAPWDVTYWKQLEGGHRVRFQDQDKTEPDFIFVENRRLWQQLAGPDKSDRDFRPPASIEYFKWCWCAWT